MLASALGSSVGRNICTHALTKKRLAHRDYTQQQHSLEMRRRLAQRGENDVLIMETLSRGGDALVRKNGMKNWCRGICTVVLANNILLFFMRGRLLYLTDDYVNGGNFSFRAWRIKVITFSSAGAPAGRLVPGGT